MLPVAGSGQSRLIRLGSGSSHGSREVGYIQSVEASNVGSRMTRCSLAVIRDVCHQDFCCELPASKGFSRFPHLAPPPDFRDLIPGAAAPEFA